MGASALLAFIMLISVCAMAQAVPELQNAFKGEVGLSDAQIASILNGQAVSKALPSRKPSEVFVFGSVYVQADPASYVKFATDLNRLRQTPGLHDYLLNYPRIAPPNIASFLGGQRQVRPQANAANRAGSDDEGHIAQPA
jgi:hypothetical protein